MKERSGGSLLCGGRTVVECQRRNREEGADKRSEASQVRGLMGSVSISLRKLPRGTRRMKDYAEEVDQSGNCNWTESNETEDE